MDPFQFCIRIQGVGDGGKNNQLLKLQTLINDYRYMQFDVTMSRNYVFVQLFDTAFVWFLHANLVPKVGPSLMIFYLLADIKKSSLTRRI